MSLPYWVFKEVGPLAQKFQVHSSSSDGDCFFDSIRIILNTVNIERTTQQLRQVVAAPVLDENDEIVNRTITNWIELYQGAVKENDRALMEEYRHMMPLAEAKFPLDAAHRQTLYNVMLTRHYWGEHHACRMIEEQTQMRFLIFCEDTKRPQLTWYHSTLFKPTNYCFLYLRYQHYMPVSLNGQFIYKWDDIPYDIQLFFSSSHRKPKV